MRNILVYNSLAWPRRGDIELWNLIVLSPFVRLACLSPQSLSSRREDFPAVPKPDRLSAMTGPNVQRDHS